MTKQSASRLGLWRRLSRHNFSPRKISRPILRRFVHQHGTTDRTLMIHPEEGVDRFPDRFVVSKRKKDNPDILAGTQFPELSQIPSESFSTIVCCGLLEHISDPWRFVGELRRILKPGGKLIMTCSSCFSLHESPDDYFRFTPFGIQTLFRDWSGFEVLRGNCGPFTTIGILLQRILLQCEIFPPLRPVIEIMVHAFPTLDRFVVRQYGSRAEMDESTECDTMMPSNIQLVAVK